MSQSFNSHSVTRALVYIIVTSVFLSACNEPSSPNIEPSISQPTGETAIKEEEEKELTMAIIQNKREKIVAGNIILDEGEKKAFWDLYGQYQKDMEELRKKEWR